MKYATGYHQGLAMSSTVNGAEYVKFLMRLAPRHQQRNMTCTKWVVEKNDDINSNETEIFNSYLFLSDVEKQLRKKKWTTIVIKFYNFTQLVTPLLQSFFIKYSH